MGAPLLKRIHYLAAHELDLKGWLCTEVMIAVFVLWAVLIKEDRISGNETKVV